MRVHARAHRGTENGKRVCIVLKVTDGGSGGMNGTLLRSTPYVYIRWLAEIFIAFSNVRRCHCGKSTCSRSRFFFPLSLSFLLPFFPILVSGIHNARFFYDIAMHFLKGLFSFLFFDFVNGSCSPRWSTNLDHGQGFYYILAIVSYDSYRRKKNLISFLIFSWKGNNKISQAKNSNHRSLNDSKNYFIEQTTWLETLRVPNTSFKILPILFRSILRQLFSLVSWKWRLSEKETATLLILFAMNRRLK